MLNVFENLMGQRMFGNANNGDFFFESERIYRFFCVRFFASAFLHFLKFSNLFKIINFCF